MDTHETDERVLCPDGNCTGLLDAAGCCNTCGRVGEVAPREADDAARGEPEEAPDAAPDATPPPAATPTATTDDDGFDARVLCPDGTCVGVLDAAGVCGTCGRTA